MMQVSVFIEDEIAVDRVFLKSRRREAFRVRLEFRPRWVADIDAEPTYIGWIADVDALKLLWAQVKAQLPSPPELLNVRLADPSVENLAKCIARQMQAAVASKIPDIDVFRVEVRAENFQYGAVAEVRR